MLNGDVLTDIDLTAQIAQHERRGATGTLALVPVPDPSAYGLVRLNDDASVKEFLEKPPADQIDTNLISAGAYVLERSVLDLDPGRQAGVDRARGLAATRGQRPLRLHRATPTGSTSGRPSATSRARSTSSRATWRQRWQSDWGAASSRCPRMRSSTVASSRPRSSSAACTSRQARTSGASSCWATGCASARQHGRAQRRAAGRRDRRRLRAARLHRRTRRAHRRPARRSRTVPCWARASRSAPSNVVTRGARVFPGVELPDGALRF